MRSRLLTVFLSIALLLSISVFLSSYTNNVRLPDNHQGYEPVQPIAFSHRLHAGEMGVACLYCHFGAEKSKHAGIPPANVCMNCHKYVSAPFLETKAEEKIAEKEKRKPRAIISPEIKKLYDAFAWNSEMKRDTTKEMLPIQWKKIHNVPDYVYFDHRPHIGAGVLCQSCHGDIETMERVRQYSDLTMGWCVNCHRDVNKNGVNGKAVHAAIDCSTCHY